MNKDYSVNNIIYGDVNKNKKGKMPDSNALAAKYVVLIEILVKKGTSEMLADKYGRRFPGQEDNEMLSDFPSKEGDEKNIIELKIEQIKGSDMQNINFMIVSKSPGNIEEGDPLFNLNNNILGVKIVGGIVPSSSL